MARVKFHLAHIASLNFRGLCAYLEIVETIAWGLTSLGYDVTMAENKLDTNRRNIVFGFQMLPEHLLDTLPTNTIVYNLEQIGGHNIDNLRRAYHAAAQRLQIWDYSEHNLRLWRELDPVNPALYVPVGWAPVLARIPQDVQQDIDVLFYGQPGERRFAIFKELCDARVCSVFVYGLYGASKDSLIARSKIVNIGNDETSRIFEVVRVSYLLANSKAVVADLRPQTSVEPDLHDAIAFAPPDRICATCIALLQDDTARRQMQKRGEEVIRKRDIRTILARALANDRVS